MHFLNFKKLKIWKASVPRPWMILPLFESEVSEGEPIRWLYKLILGLNRRKHRLYQIRSATLTNFFKKSTLDPEGKRVPNQIVDFKKKKNYSFVCQWLTR